jgi:hypothetical protein
VKPWLWQDGEAVITSPSSPPCCVPSGMKVGRRQGRGISIQCEGRNGENSCPDRIFVSNALQEGRVAYPITTDN